MTPAQRNDINNSNTSQLFSKRNERTNKTRLESSSWRCNSLFSARPMHSPKIRRKKRRQQNDSHTSSACRVYLFGICLHAISFANNCICHLKVLCFFFKWMNSFSLSLSVSLSPSLLCLGHDLNGEMCERTGCPQRTAQNCILRIPSEKVKANHTRVLHSFVRLQRALCASSAVNVCNL